VSKWKINSVRRDEFDAVFAGMAYLFGIMALGGGVFTIFKWLSSVTGMALIYILQEWAGVSLLFLIYATLGRPELIVKPEGLRVIFRLLIIDNVLVSLAALCVVVLGVVL